MKKFFNVMMPIVLLVMLSIIMLLAIFGGVNLHNSISTANKSYPVNFTQTEYSVVNFQGRVYNIVKDVNNDYLYYCSDVEGQLVPVLDKDGNHTKVWNVQ